ncbi:hypothetical protein QUF61_17975 [Candidatus Venteria ishoeyi]|uniref:hypothetical protein n=1 Tax=Candidatus Venteria ishoeyi TaxID=1899563 RepID=UPI0025A67EB9|nr:hypothetical protein [Candidatus Venteria ishoeyi]MDM8548383.1 hypothetical protein [Candidatus Venteria ishoeyi]
MDQAITATGEPSGFDRENPLTNGIIELSPDGTKIIAIDQDGNTTTRTDGLFYDGSSANAREFAISPVSVGDGGDGTYIVWVEGTKKVISTTQKVTFPNQSGLQFVYHETAGTITSSNVFSFDYFTKTPITAVVYGNSVDQALVTFGDERHGVQMSGATHKYLHMTEGTRYVSGMELQGVVDGGTTYTQITSGVAYDEDLPITSSQQADAPFLWRDGAFWAVLTDSTDIAHLDGGATQFNCDTAYVNYGTAGTDYTPTGLYELRDVTGNDRMIMFFILTNDAEFPYVKVLGQKVYSNSANARADVGTAINELALDGLPSPEFLPIYAVIVDRLGQVDDVSADEVIVDLRQAKEGGTGTISGVATVHNDTTGRSDADSHPISAITNLQTTLDTKLENLSAQSIKTLSDVFTTMSPIDGQVLTYDTTNGWQSETPASGVTDHTLLSNIGTNTHVQIDTHIADDTKHRVINDAGTTATELFSASKIIADLALKQNTLTFDTVPTDTSTNPVESNGVFDSLALKADDTNVVHKTGVETAAGEKTFSDKLTANDGFDAISTSSVPANVRSLGTKVYLRLTNSASSTGFVGYESTDLSLWTDNTKRVTVDSTGNVGIGTDTPHTKLDVYSTIVSPTIGEAAGVGSIRDTSSAADLTGDSGLEFKIAGNSNGYGAKIQALNSGGAQLVFANRHGSSAWVERMRIDNDGDVGIGTSPDEKLHIKDGDILIEDTLPKLGIKNSTEGSRFNLVAGASGELTIRDENDVRVTVDSAGDVGIGIAPDDKLHVDGNIKIKAAQKLYSDGYVTIESGTGTGMQFNTDGSNNRVQILSNGNVGIGTTSPLGKLHIHGGDATKPALYLSGGTADVAFPDGEAFQMGHWNGVDTFTNRFHITSGGNVGIGKMPFAKLDILSSNATHGDIMLDPGGSALGDKMGMHVDQSGNNTTKLHLGRRSTGDSVFQKYMTMDFDGKVGIGSPTPSAALDIKMADAEININDTNGTPYLRFRSNGTTTGAVHSNSSGDLMLAVSGASTRQTISSAGAIRFHSYGAGTLVTDAGGNITASSDENLKDIKRDFTT